MQSIPHDLLTFLEELTLNNNRDWFMQNKKRFDLIQAEFVTFLQELIVAIGEFDPTIRHIEAKKCILRIYRDTRFSDDKTPYKTSISAHILEGGRKSEHQKSGYYVRLAPGNSFLAGGAHLPPAKWISAIRNKIVEDGSTLRSILSNPTFQTYFGELRGDELKTAPRGYAKDHPEIDLLRKKSFLAVHDLSDEQVVNSGFGSHCK
jgi:uncharacterized protein (TIGR02453 family)